MNTIRKIVNRNLSGRIVLFLFILTSIIYALMLVITIPKIMEFSNGMKLLDVIPTGYDSDYIHSLFSTLGEEGRNYYLFNQIPIDMIFPGLYGISYCLITAYLIKKIHKLDSSFLYLCILPIIAGLADYFENIGIITMLVSYPKLPQFLMSATSIFTIIKSITIAIYSIALIIVLIALGIQTIKANKIVGNNL